MSKLRNDIALHVSDLTKVYRKGQGQDTIHALNGVSFEVKKGEVLGIIGANGAGKSTLLKVLSEITAPTSGSIEYRGRITSILDIGTGFHPDLSGIDNIFLNGSILGFSKAEIQKALPEIIAFSGLEEFMHMPVKQYSSGMYLRLAFSVAFHFDMDILLLDEILAVGDADFRVKCFGVMQKLIAEGKTIIIVSHNFDMIGDLCEKCIWLEKGSIQKIGLTSQVINEYLDSHAVSNMTGAHSEPESDYLKSISVNGGKGTRISVADEINIEIEVSKPFEGTVQVFLSLFNDLGIKVLSDSMNLRNKLTEPISRGLYIYTCSIPGGWLSTGNYFIGLTLTKNREEDLLESKNLASFRVSPDLKNPDNKLNVFSGSIHPILQWSIKKHIKNYNIPRIDADSLEGSNLFDAILSDEIDGFIINNAFSQDEINQLTEKILNIDGNRFICNSNLYTYPDTFASFINRKPTETDIQQYFSRNKGILENELELLGLPFFKRVQSIMKSASNQFRFETIEGNHPEGIYPPYTIRKLSADGRLHTHCGNFFYEPFRTFYNDLETQVEVHDQLSYFTPVMKPKSGGELVLYHLRWEAGQKKQDDTPNLVSITRPNHPTFEADPTAKVGCEIIDLNCGDLIVFKGGEIWHKVSQPSNGEERITIGGFFGKSKKNNNTFGAWS